MKKLIFILLLSSCQNVYYVAIDKSGEAHGFTGKPHRADSIWKGNKKQDLPNIWQLTWNDEPLEILRDK